MLLLHVTSTWKLDGGLNWQTFKLWVDFPSRWQIFSDCSMGCKIKFKWNVHKNENSEWLTKLSSFPSWWQMVKSDENQTQKGENSEGLTK